MQEKHSTMTAVCEGSDDTPEEQYKEKARKLSRLVVSTYAMLTTTPRDINT